MPLRSYETNENNHVPRMNSWQRIDIDSNAENINRFTILKQAYMSSIGDAYYKAEVFLYNRGIVNLNHRRAMFMLTPIVSLVLLTWGGTAINNKIHGDTDDRSSITFNQPVQPERVVPVKYPDLSPSDGKTVCDEGTEVVVPGEGPESRINARNQPDTEGTTYLFTIEPGSILRAVGSCVHASDNAQWAVVSLVQESSQGIVYKPDFNGPGLGEPFTGPVPPEFFVRADLVRVIEE